MAGSGWHRHRREAEVGGRGLEGGADALRGRGRVATPDRLDRDAEPVRPSGLLGATGERTRERVELVRVLRATFDSQRRASGYDVEGPGLDSNVTDRGDGARELRHDGIPHGEREGGGAHRRVAPGV